MSTHTSHTPSCKCHLHANPRCFTLGPCMTSFDLICIPADIAHTASLCRQCSNNACTAGQPAAWPAHATQLKHTYCLKYRQEAAMQHTNKQAHRGPLHCLEQTTTPSAYVKHASCTAAMTQAGEHGEISRGALSSTAPRHTDNIAGSVTSSDHKRLDRCDSKHIPAAVATSNACHRLTVSQLLYSQFTLMRS